MKKFWILVISLNLVITRFSVDLVLGKDLKKEFLVDLWMERTIVPEKKLDCKSIENCKVLKEDYTGYYHGRIYKAQVVEIPLELTDSFKNKVQTTIEIDILTESLFELNYFVLGLAPASSFYNSIKDPQTELRFVPIQKEIVLLYQNDFKDVKKYNFDVKKASFNKTGYYIDSLLIYKLNINMSFQSSVTNQSAICLHDHEENETNYFFKGYKFFKSEWIDLFTNLEQVIFGKMIENYLTFDVISAGEQDFRIPYDKELFEAYSNYPMRADISMNSPLSSTCELYVGDFFFKRSGIKVYLGKDEDNKDLKVTFSIDIHSYEFPNSYYLKYILIFLLFISLIFLIVFYFLKKKKNTNTEQNKEIYQEINSS